MSILSFFKQNKNRFIFEIEIANSQLSASSIDASLATKIRIFHKLQKDTFDIHVKFLFKEFKDKFKNDNDLLKRSCLELGVMYYYIFSREFDSKNVDVDITQNYFIPLFHNFIGLETKVIEIGYEDLYDFFDKKALFFEDALNSLRDILLSNYFSSVFIENPMVTGSPKIKVFSDLDVFQLMGVSSHVHMLIKIMRIQVNEFIRVFNFKN